MTAYNEKFNLQKQQVGQPHRPTIKTKRLRHKHNPNTQGYLLFRFLLVFISALLMKKHIKFSLLWQFIFSALRLPFQLLALAVLHIAAAQFQFPVMPSSGVFAVVISPGLPLWVAVFIHWLAAALFGFIHLVSVLFRHCPFRALT